MSDTPETDELRDLFENHEHRANMGDVWELCESLERQRDAYAETLKLLRVECYDFIDQRHPELAQEGEKGQESALP